MSTNKINDLNEKIKSILDSFSSNICLLDEKGNIEVTNNLWQNFARENNGELNRVGTGVNYLSICDNTEGEGKDTAYQFAGGIRSVINCTQNYFELEYPCHSPNEERWFIGRVTPYIKTGKNYKRKVVVSHEDITEKKLSERNKLMVHHFLNNTIDLITYHDLNMNIIWTNTAVEKYLNKSQEEIAGKKCYEAWHGRHTSCETCPVKEAIQTGRNASKETIDKENRYFNIIGSPVKDENGEVTGVIKTNIEITQTKQIEEDLNIKEQAIDTAINATALADIEGKLVYINHSFLELLGYDNEEEVLGTSLLSFWNEPIVADEMFNALLNGESWNGDVTIVRKDGKLIEANFSASNTYNQDSSHVSIIATFIDITERKKTERSLIRFRNALDSSADSIFIIDYPSFNFVDVNKSACIELGYSKQELLQLTPFDLKTISEEKLRQKFEQAINCSLFTNSSFQGRECGETFETFHQRKNGTVFPVEISIRYSDIPDEKWFIASVRNISDRKKAEEKLYYLSYHDTLTGLYNRAYLEEEMKRYDVKRQLPISVVMVDVNGLKLVNDTYGHESGDNLLIKTGKILKNVSRNEDLVVRWGGDEFIIFLPRTNKEQTEAIVKRITEESDNHYVNDVPIKIAVGASTKINFEELLEDVFRTAENRMYQNKLTERNSARSDIISALLGTLKEKSDETEEHARRINDLGLKFGKSLGLKKVDLDKLSLLATMHDIGKVVISEDILRKPTKLNEEEWEKVKEHPETGQRIACTSESLIYIAEEILAHHERWDGQGYPYGLTGEEIPYLARIIAIIDAYDVMTNGRIYKHAKTKDEAMKELKRCAGTQFDPNLVHVFFDIVR